MRRPTHRVPPLSSRRARPWACPRRWTGGFRRAVLAGWLSLWLVGGAVTAAEPERIPLSELDPRSARQGWGELGLDQSVTGGPLQIGAQPFARGLGTHAHSELIFAVEPSYDRFEAWVGVDAAMARFPKASVTFVVLADGKERFNSGMMRPDTPAILVSLPLTGIKELTLVVTDAGDGIDGDNADWAEAAFVLRRSPPTPEQPLAARFDRLRPPMLSPPEPAMFQLATPELTLEFSERGELTSVYFPRAKARRAIKGGTALAGCKPADFLTVRRLKRGGLQFIKPLVFEASGQHCRLLESFLPQKDSVRWEIEIESTGPPWTTGIETWLAWPTNQSAQFWTAWDDPECRRDRWRDPLAPQPLANSRRFYGAPHWDETRPPSGYSPGTGNRFVVPLAVLVEPSRDLGLSLVLSPEDTLRELVLTTHRSGALRFTRRDHRLGGPQPVRFGLDLVAHAGDWRSGLGWMARRYPSYFHPPNPRARDIAGLGAYSDWEGELDVAKLKRMGFRVNWKASYDFPYMGMFLPPIPDDQPYRRFVKGNLTSIQQLRDYSRRMRAWDFEVLNYFNASEFGGVTGMPSGPDPGLPPAERWRNVHNFMASEIPDGILRDLAGKPYGSWEGCVAMDCGGPRYRAFLLEQARRHLERLPESAGLCIDRLDWLRLYNFEADDGLTWRRDRPCRALYQSWLSLLGELGPMVHASNKVIFVNAMVNRTELLRHVDGIYHEFGHDGFELNGAALQCVRKPCLAWTPDERTLGPEPDAYFQRHLYLGVFPTAPLPANDHTIGPSPSADRFYLDYGPLFDALRGRQWVLVAHPLTVAPASAKANLFEVPGGYLIPVTFGGDSARISVQWSALARLSRRSGSPPCAALHPGADRWAPLTPKARRDTLQLDVPLARGCAIIRIEGR